MPLTPAVSPHSRVYRIAWWGRAFALFFLIFSSLWVREIFLELISGAASLNPWETLFTAVWVIGSSVLVVSSFKAKVILFEDSIEYRGPFGRQRLRFDEIRGRREWVDREGEENAYYLKLESDDDRVPSITLQKLFNFDAAFYEWFNSLPDLEAAEKLKPKSSDLGLV